MILRSKCCTGKAMSFQGFSHWGPTLVSRFFEKKYWLASALRLIHHPIPRAACAPAITLRSTSARSTSGGGRFSATLTPKSKRLRCPGSRSGTAISSEWFYGPELEFSGSK
jgi:hypothetical protein